MAKTVLQINSKNVTKDHRRSLYSCASAFGYLVKLRIFNITHKPIELKTKYY